MSFKEVSSLNAENVIALGKKDKKTGKPYPKQAEGYYLGNRTVESKRGESTLHFLQTPKGNLGLWGTTDLNRKLGGVPAGTMVRVTHTGMKPTPNGEMYIYKVELDADNTIELSSPVESSTYSDDEDSTEDTDSDEDTTEDTGYDAVVAAKERQSKVEELLRKGRAKN